MNKIPIINQIIKDTRKELKLNQSDFAKLINKSLPTIKKYDTGGIIPQNTLILICDILNLDYNDLILQQFEENKRKGSEFYEHLINEPIRLHKDSEWLESEQTKKIELLKKKLNLLYNFSECELEGLPFYSEYKNKRFYIKSFSDNEVIQILNINEVHNLIDEMSDFLEYRKYKLNKTKK